MVLCLFVDCHARSGRDRDVSFFRVPVIDKKNGEEAEELSTEHRTKLITAISRDDLTEQILKNDRVCSRHFVSSHPAKPWDKYNVDWVPTLNLRHTKRKAEDMGKAVQERAERAQVRRKKKLNEAKTMIKENRLRLNDEGTQVSNILFTSTSDDLDTTTEEFVLSYGDQELGEKEKCHQAEVKSFDEMSTQTEVLTRTPKLKCYDASSQTDEFDYLFNTNKKVTDFGEEYFRNSNNKVLFYIGLPSYEILNFVFELVSPSASRRSKTLSPFKEFVMVLIKLRLNVPFQDLAYQLNISVPTVSWTFHSWLITMDIRLSPFIHWPDHESLKRSMPQCFQFSFGTKITVIIDCFEIFIEKPTNLFVRAQTFSSYKHHITIKVLIGITPQGSISFVSEARGGQTSDKVLTENCGILSKLVPGDMVMADRVFMRVLHSRGQSW